MKGGRLRWVIKAYLLTLDLYTAALMKQGVFVPIVIPGSEMAVTLMIVVADRAKRAGRHWRPDQAGKGKQT